ncbi:hypothetical protein OIU84_000408 [Salix udensis]|uniref:Translation initiation factor 5A C-terminal domain-containing protein n=1 Tax=Salix udensis TaxID=889485 RepID=A0AAD6L4K8_9ROSI|nr:hypothetical protein OIU84_000408 [Salix udensis]
MSAKIEYRIVKLGDLEVLTLGNEKAMRDAIKGMNRTDLDGRNITVTEAQSCGSVSKQHTRDAKCHFVGIDIFNGKKLEDIVPSSLNCDVPHVNRVDYQLIDISEDGFVSLLTENGNTKDDLRLPTDDSLLKIKDGFGNRKDLVVSAMGEEQICALKDIGPKN